MRLEARGSSLGLQPKLIRSLRVFLTRFSCDYHKLVAEQGRSALRSELGEETCRVRRTLGAFEVQGANRV